VYDHFLANDPTEFTRESLLAFSEKTYNIIEMYTGSLPEQFALMFPFMKSHNWLFNYRTKWGIEKGLGGVVRRSAYLTESQTAFDLFERHYQLLEDCYRQFWAEVKPFAQKQMDQLLNN
jgi:acyl carrier protein phosphodiesterase